MTLQINCVRCGYPLPPLEGDEARLYLAGQGAVAQHPAGQCPPQLAAAAQAGGLQLVGPSGQPADQPVSRHFEAQLRVVEVFPAEERSEVVFEITAARTAPSAVAAVEPQGPLADEIGRKWQAAAEHVHLADVPVVPPSAGA